MDNAIRHFDNAAPEGNVSAPAEDIKRDAVDFYSLAFLLTGNPDVSIDIAAGAAGSKDDTAPFFAQWMRDWQRRIVIGKALTAVRNELAYSARRTRRARANAMATSQSDYSSRRVETKPDLERALLAIDLFPRAALLLLVFEGMRIADAASLLDTDPALLKKAQAIGAQELAANLAGATAPAVSGSPRRPCLAGRAGRSLRSQN